MKVSKTAGRGFRAQSAMEFMSVYGFGLLAVVITAGLIYAALGISSSTVQNSCQFPGYLTCREILVGSNSVSGNAVIVMSNSQEYAISNAVVTLSTPDHGVFTGACQPDFVLSGGSFECSLGEANSLPSGQLLSGVVYLSANVCTSITQAGCASPIAQTYGGTFQVHSSIEIPAPKCSIILSAENTTQIANGAGDPLAAQVSILGTSIAGATVAFSSNDPHVEFQSLYSNSNYAGNSLSSASSNTPGSANIIAVFGSCTSSETVTFKPVPLNSNIFPVFSSIKSGQTQEIYLGSTGGLPPYTYQWYEEAPGANSFSQISGATSSNYLLNTNQQTALGNYTFYANVIDSETPALITTTSNSIIQVSINTPSGIAAYVPITITNSQSSNTPLNFQQMVTVDSAAYSSYEASNLQNIEFFYANGIILNSWLESGNSNAASSTLYWLNIGSQIPASSSLTVYMGFASQSTNLFNTATTGEAPQLSPSYAEYDEYVALSTVTICWKFRGVFEDWEFVIVIGTYAAMPDGVLMLT